LKLDANKKKKLNIGWLKYVCVRKLDNNRVEKNKIPSLNNLSKNVCFMQVV
jgi:hypothetical protein